jgi:hypothetical protein
MGGAYLFYYYQRRRMSMVNALVNRARISLAFPQLERNKQVCTFIATARVLSNWKWTDIDHKTFLEFWRLSAPGGDAEHCFLRIPQTEYYFSEKPPSDALERMPSVESILSLAALE